MYLYVNKSLLLFETLSVIEGAIRTLKIWEQIAHVPYLRVILELIVNQVV
jgi:hypothetical protein